MTGTLAIITPQLGAVSETFIRRHVEDILPGQTVAIARHSSHPQGGRWVSPCPVLFLDEIARRLSHRVARRLWKSDADLIARSIEAFLMKHQVERVLGEYLHLFVEFVPLLNRLGIPYVVQGHGIDLSAALRDADMAKRYLSFRSAEAILTRCEFHRTRLIELGLPAEIIHVNPGGVNIPATRPLRSEDSQKRFLAVGRMVPKKGPIYLLEAFRQAAVEDPEITLDYVGGGELFEAARQFVDATGMCNRIRLRGSVSEEVKQSLWQECGVFVQHSIVDEATGDEEGLPAAIQEAMAAGMIVISTFHSGIPEAIDDGVSGWLEPERDVKALAKRMIHVSNQTINAEPMRQAAFEKASSLYSWEAERNRILSAFDQMASLKA